MQIFAFKFCEFFKNKFLIIIITRRYINPCSVFLSSFVEFVFPSSLWNFVLKGLVYKEKDPGGKLNFHNILILGPLFQLLLEIYFWFLYFCAICQFFHIGRAAFIYINVDRIESSECSTCSYCGFQILRLNNFFL